MIKFFRNIRRTLSSEGMTRRNLKYALGEMLLIVLGILIALQIQNWNESRKQELLFQAGLEQVFNTLSTDIELFNNSMTYLEKQSNALEGILQSLDSVHPRHIIEGLYFVAASTPPQIYESSRFAQNFPYNPEISEHRELATQISNYALRLEWKNTLMSSRVFDQLQEAGIAYPLVNSVTEGIVDNPDYYTDSDFQKLDRLLKDDVFVPSLKTLKTALIYEWHTYNNWKSDAASLMKLIQTYYPGVRLLYKNVSLIGTSLAGWDTGDPRSIQDFPLIETDLEKYIWQTDIYLKEGEVKFRCRESWAQNWGGSEFPTGRAQRDGPNISIPEAGLYRVTLNISEGNYTFELLEAN